MKEKNIKHIDFDIYVNDYNFSEDCRNFEKKYGDVKYVGEKNIPNMFKRFI